MNITTQIHERIEHDHRMDSCNLYELIEKVLEAEQFIKDKEMSDYMYQLALDNVNKDIEGKA